MLLQLASPVRRPGYGCGTVYKLTPSGSGWTETVLYRFTDANQATDGIDPFGGVILDGSGNLIGTTSCGGPNQGGLFLSFRPAAEVGTLPSWPRFLTMVATVGPPGT